MALPLVTLSIYEKDGIVSNKVLYCKGRFANKTIYHYTMVERRTIDIKHNIITL